MVGFFVCVFVGVVTVILLFEDQTVAIISSQLWGNGMVCTTEGKRET